MFGNQPTVLCKTTWKERAWSPVWRSSSENSLHIKLKCLIFFRTMQNRVILTIRSNIWPAVLVFQGKWKATKVQCMLDFSVQLFYCVTTELGEAEFVKEACCHWCFLLETGEANMAMNESPKNFTRRAMRFSAFTGVMWYQRTSLSVPVWSLQSLYKCPSKVYVWETLDHIAMPYRCVWFAGTQRNGSKQLAEFVPCLMLHIPG